MLRVLTIGKIDRKFTDQINEYAKRITRYDKIEILECKTEETATRYAEKSYLIVLDEHGKTCGSHIFSALLNKINMEHKNISFVLGPAEGLSDSMKDKADLVLALSELTFQHDIALLVLMEQIYRAFAIIKGENYHK